MTSRKHQGALLLYFLLSCLLTWPLPRYITTHVPGNGIDDPSLAWNLWWIKHRLVEQLNVDIFHADWMFHPVDINLAFYTLTPLNGLISTPLQLATSLIVSSNLVLLSSYVIGGYGAFLLCYSLLTRTALTSGRFRASGGFRSSDRHLRMPTPLNTPTPEDGASSDAALLWWASLFGGMVYAFASAKLFYAALGQFNIASSHWVPFCILYLLRIHQRDDRAWRWRNSLLCALFLVLQAWSELTYASFLIIFIVIYAIWILIGQLTQAVTVKVSHRPVGAILFQQIPFVGLALLFVLGISPFLAAMIPDLVREGDFFGSGGGFAEWFSADLVGYLVPTRLHPLFGDWVGGLHQSGFSNDVGQHIYLGYGLLVLIVLGAVAMVRPHLTSPTLGEGLLRRWGVGGWFWIFNLLFFWLLTLGPNPRWFGQPFSISGPFALISRLPFFSGNRYPSRYAIMLLICAAVLAAFGLLWLLQRSRLRPKAGMVTVTVIALFLVEHLSIPMPLNLSTTPPIYQQIADASSDSTSDFASDSAGDFTDDFTVLELPTGWRNGAYVLGKSDKLIMMQQWYQTIHGKRRLGGNTSRNPWFKFEYFVNAPLLGDLVALMNADEKNFAPVIYGITDEMIAQSPPSLQPYLQRSDGQLGEIIERSQKSAPTVIDFLGVEYITVRVEKSSAALLRFVDEALPLILVDEQQGIDWDGEAETIRLYRVEEGAGDWQLGKGERVYDIGGEMGALYLAEGWASLVGDDRIRYVLRNEVDLLLDLPNVAGDLSIDWVGREPRVSLNGVRLSLSGQGEYDGEPDDMPLMSSNWQIPAGLADQPVDRLTLCFDGVPWPYHELVEPREEVGWPVGTAGASLAADSAIVVMSAGQESGAFARIFVNGKNVAPGTVGYNLAALTQAGELLDVAAFNTIADLSESSRLAEWVAQWPDGTIIAGAASDAVDTHQATMLTEEAVDALRVVGIGQDPRGRHRWGHAFVGVVGAAPGSAPEAAQLIGVASVMVGSSLDGEKAYGGVAEVRFLGE